MSKKNKRQTPRAVPAGRPDRGSTLIGRARVADGDKPRVRSPRLLMIEPVWVVGGGAATGNSELVRSKLRSFRPPGRIPAHGEQDPGAGRPCHGPGDTRLSVAHGDGPPRAGCGGRDRPVGAVCGVREHRARAAGC